MRYNKKGWSLLNNVKETLQMIDEKGATIIVLENTIKLTSTKKTFIDVARELEVPILGMFITKRNRFRKPYTHAINLIEDKFGFKIERSKSLVCGNNAGRHKSGLYKSDDSCCDRAFAENAQIKFCTERMFSNMPEKPWRWMDMPFEERMKYLKSEEPEPDIMEHIPWRRNCVVLVIGAPSSGKHLLSRRIVERWSEKGHISVVPPSPERIKSCLEEKETILVTGCMPTRKERARIIKVAAVNKTPVLIVHLTTPQDMCYLLGQIRVATDTSPTGSRVVTSYKSIAKYFDELQDPSKDFYGNSLSSTNLKYLKYPMLVRERPEYWGRY